MSQMALPEDKLGSRHTFVQTDRAAHELWSKLGAKNPRASALLHLFVARVGDHNAVVVSQKTLAGMTGWSERTIRRAVADLVSGNWVEVRQIGPSGTVNAYIVNRRVAWTQKRDNIRYALFDASIIVSDEEQPDQPELGQQSPLNQLPKVFSGERQLPSGDGLEPPSEPALPGMEPDLPILREPNAVQNLCRLASCCTE